MKLHRLGVALAQYSLVLLSLPCAVAHAQQTLNGPLARPVGRFWNFQVAPDGGRVVYAAEQDRCYWPEVYSVPVDGSSSSVKLSGELSGPDIELHSFLLSPDGSRVVSVFEQRIMSAPTDGSAAAIQIASMGCSTCDDALFEYGFTPDGAHVLYRDNERVDEYTTLYSVCSAPVDGSGPAVRLSEPGAFNPAPEYVGSPDGAYVAFVTDGRLYGRPIDGSAPAVRLDPGFGVAQDAMPAIAPDGTVVFPAWSGTATGLYAAPIDGSAAPVLLTGALVPGGSVGSPLLLPDGSGAVYGADALLDGQWELFFVPLDASAPPRRLSHALAPGGDVMRFDLSPDGTHAVYWAFENGVVQLFSARTDRIRPAIRLNARLVAGGNVYMLYPSRPVIFPDSRTVVYLADQRVDGRMELFSVPIDGSERPHLRKFGEPLVKRLNVPLPETSSGISWYAFAPDAGRVLYQALGSLYSVPVRGGPSIRLELGAVPMTQSILGGSRAFLVVPQDYTHDYTTDMALVSVPLEGGTPLRLSPPLALGPPEGAVRAHRSSPNGLWTVYLADEELLGVYELYSVPTEGGVPAVKLNGPLPYMGGVGGHGLPEDLDGAFEITPDGSRVVYIADQDVALETELYVAPIDGLTPAVRLGSGSDVLSGLALDPSSERVVFRQRDAQTVERLFSQRLDGSQAPLALTGSLVFRGNVESFALTPDGTGVVFRADAELDNRYELYSVPIDGSAPRRRLNPALGSSSYVTTFALTSDSARVLFLANARQSQQFELYSTRLDGGLPLELDPEFVGTGYVRRFVASPDGAWAVFVAAPSGAPVQIYAVPCDGSAVPHRLNGPLVPGGSVRDEDGAFRVSPDSRRVAYLAAQDINTKVELYAAWMDGGAPVRKLSDPLNPGSAQTSPGLRVSPDSRRVFYVASTTPSYPLTKELFVAGVAGTAPPLRLNAPLASGGEVTAFDVDCFGLNALYCAHAHYEDSKLFHVPTDASRPPRRVDLPPGIPGDAAFTANPRFALYLQGRFYQTPHYVGQTVDLHSLCLPTRLRRSNDPPEPR